VKVTLLALVTAAGLVCPSTSVAQERALPSGDGVGRLVPPALSALLPGAGQHVLHQDRKWLYLALELGAWGFFLERRHAGDEYRDRYRDFAWDNARFQTGGRTDGDFAYYETLTHWARSGAFDRDGGSSGVQPELDGATYNGSVWDLAAGLFLPGGPGSGEGDPGYPSALAYYTARAYGPEMLWDWSGAPGAQAEFSRLVDVSDSRFRQATTLLGIVIANHLLSAVDAYISAGGAPPARLRIVPAALPGTTWGVELSLRSPR
jgi:hypothetical protein